VSSLKSVALALVTAGLGLACNPRPGSEEVEAQVAAPATGNSCEALTTRLCAEFGESAEVCALSRRETARFRAEHCAAMLGRYDQVADEARRLELGMKRLAEPRRSATAVEVPAFGPTAAKVTLVEFSDFDCSDCARASRLATTVKNLYGDRVRFVFRQFPLTKHERAFLVAEASLAAQAQGRFWEYHDVLFANQHELTRSALERYAAHVGLDLAEFRRALDERRFAADVDADRALGRDVLVAEVPALFVNGQRVAVPYGVDELMAIVERGLAGG
jgi:protein-disulfide isomerase